MGRLWDRDHSQVPARWSELTIEREALDVFFVLSRIIAAPAGHSPLWVVGCPPGDLRGSILCALPERDVRFEWDALILA
jgi:hypothetical protein